MTILQDKAVIITGAGQGLGAAYAAHAAAEGARIVINDIDPAAAEGTSRALRAGGAQAVAVAGDVARWALADELVTACLDHFGRFDGLVANAGILRPAALEAATEADLRQMLEVNVMGTAAAVQAGVKQLRRAGTAGSIITVTSGAQAGDLGIGGYGASKGAVASLTYAWAMELRGSAIRLNAVSPLAATAMAAQNAQLLASQNAARVEQLPPLPPAQTSAPLVSYLLSDAAAHIHGQVIRLAARELALVTHPMLLSPVLVDDWDLAAIMRAFDGPLGAQQQPLGLSRSPL